MANFDGYDGHVPMSQSSSGPIQAQQQRSMEATKERIYKIHGNVINILEELEDRQQKKSKKELLPKSGTDYYDHSEKCDDTANEVAQGQLIACEAVLKGCDPQIKDSLRKELEEKTRKWLAVRQSKNLPKDIVDTYAEMALEIITRGKTKHATEFTEFKSKEHPMTPDDVNLLMTGQYKASEVDKEYAKDPQRKAKSPSIRAVGKEEAHFLSLSGYGDKCLVLLSDGTILSFKGSNWKMESKVTNANFTRIQGLPRCLKHKVLAINESGETFIADSNCQIWVPCRVGDTQVLNIVVGTESVLAVDIKNNVWKLESGNGLMWTKFFHFPIFKGMIDIVLGKTKRWAVNSGGQILVYDQSNKWQVDDTQPERVKFAKVYANLWNDQVFAIDVNGNVYSKLSQKDLEWSQDKKRTKTSDPRTDGHNNYRYR
ncbi:uncharacterized protein LOC127732098 [Mytilus californianus]|uniref:uncharacterized protein LOC127732098 n=1 Tax=Mytilus californianus TaxID=6549 RepID=UPI0022479345|nr:uncharacterized protein LOC127732098 [Mytilus californianus]